MAQGRDHGPSSEAQRTAQPDPETAEIERFRVPLRLIAARRIGDWTAAEDIAQEAIRRTLEALRAGKVLNPAALPGFLSQTTINICLDRSRAAGRENRALGRFAASPRPPAEDQLSGLLSSERRAQVQEAFHQLGEDDRIVLELSYLDSRPTAEIASRLNLTEGNVRVRRHRALRRLAEILGVTRESDRRLKS